MRWGRTDGWLERSGVGLEAVSHTYAATGTYMAALTVDNVCGVEDSERVTVEEGTCEAVQIKVLSADPEVRALCQRASRPPWMAAGLPVAHPEEHVM